MRGPVVVGFILFVILAAVAAVLAALLLPYHDGADVAADLEVTLPAAVAPLLPRPQYLPPRAAEAPAAARDQVLRGQAFLVRRGDSGPATRAITCSSCHFSGGLTEGGRNQGLSLVGVAAHYVPQAPLERLDLRIADCFRTNLNVSPPAADSDEMVAIATYLRWISSGVPFWAAVPWLHPEPMTSATAPDAAAGERIWRDTCSPCHGERGGGTRIAPPTWGPTSFTADSRMLEAGILERFIADNMPRGNPDLGPQQAVDVAAFIRRQPRPAARPR